MHAATNIDTPPFPGALAQPSSPATAASELSHYQIIRRNGAVVPFEPQKIAVAMMKAFLAVHGTQGAASASVREVVDALTHAVVRALVRSRPGGGTFHIEDVQDQVELGLMRGGHHEVARAYVLYRERRAQERSHQSDTRIPPTPALHVLDAGQRVVLDLDRLRGLIESACASLGDSVQAEPIVQETLRNLYDGVPLDAVHKAAILAARTLIETDPGYTHATARLLLHTIAREVLGREVAQADMAQSYADYFPQAIRKGVENQLLDERLLQFDLPRLGAALKAERDLQFDYLGLQTLYDRYFLHVRKTRIELPQVFFMRVAMGLALNEIDREARAIEFYEVLSSFDFMSSTPTLFNSGTLRSQLSSCYLTTVPDQLDGIYESIKENALLSKYAGGLGNDWTRVRALGSHIKGTNGESQGVVPFLKVVNDTAVAVNQGGKRKGAVCAYLETWHLDIEEFLELRKNTGDDRRRTHDMNTANWIPDLFMKRVMEKGEWTLFSPSDVPDLHDLFGAAFERAYVAYEERARRGEIRPSKTVQATDLWRRRCDAQHLDVEQRRQQAAPGRGAPALPELRRVQRPLLGGSDRNVAYAQGAGDTGVGQARFARASHSGHHQFDDFDVHAGTVKPYSLFSPNAVGLGRRPTARSGGTRNVRTLCALRSGLAPARGLRRGARRLRVRAALERGADAVAAGGAPAAHWRAADSPAALGPRAVVGEGRDDRHEAHQRARRGGF